MRRSVATVSLSGTLRHKLEAVAAARFDGVELFENDFITFDGSARELRAMAGDLGLGIDLYQPFRDFEGMPDGAFLKSLERAERKFDVMEALGAPLMLVCSNTSPQSLADPERAAAQLRTLAERAARRNLRIGFEALAWGRHVNRWRQAWAIVERADHPHLGLILDSFHTLSLKDDFDGIAELPGERIFFLQMADAPLLSMDVLQWARHHRNFPGQGQLDCDGFFLQVLRSGYAGTLSLEIFNDQFRETPNRRTAVDAMRSLLFLESRAREQLQAGAQAQRQSQSQAQPRPQDGAAVDGAALGRLALFDPPAPARIDGYAFLEFGVDDAAASALGDLLTRLGFERVGRHATKAASLYRQHGIEIVLNAEPGSPARARFDTEGPSVGAIGLAVDDPVRAANRAAALLSARHESPRAASELRLPAIVAPGGTVVHFVTADAGAALDADFPRDAASVEVGAGSVATGGASSARCGLERIDHIALGLAPDQFDTWMLFSRAVLGLERGDSLELADPFGLIRTSGVADAARRLRIVLNVSLGQRTRTARQVSATGRAGGGVHHIALATRDIFETMRRLRERGVRFVPISANYYDDLIARLDLDESLVRRMQALDIVYDRAPGGEYFHAYGEPFDDRFFFEIVQREHYDGYGAVNAPARMASQEQRAPSAP
jgi:4-hydroxyphenylpyruvate dioxygenase